MISFRKTGPPYFSLFMPVSRVLGRHTFRGFIAFFTSAVPKVTPRPLLVHMGICSKDCSQFSGPVDNMFLDSDLGDPAINGCGVAPLIRPGWVQIDGSLLLVLVTTNRGPWRRTALSNIETLASWHVQFEQEHVIEDRNHVQ